MTSSALSTSGRRAIFSDALSVKTFSQPAARYLDQGDTAVDDLPKPTEVRLDRASGRVRRPATPDDVKQIRAAIADQRASVVPDPTSAFRYLTVDGIAGDARALARIRSKILAAHRVAAAGTPLTYLPAENGLAFGIADDDAEDRLKNLEANVKRFAKRLKWTIAICPEGWVVPEPSEDAPREA